eukprot:28995_1
MDIQNDCNTKISLITDAEMSLFIPKCDVVLLGADTIDMNKRIVLNKTGSFAACLIAKYFKIPVYIISHQSKIENINNDNIWNELNGIEYIQTYKNNFDCELVFEEMDKMELIKDWKQIVESKLGSKGANKNKFDEIDIRNIYFEPVSFDLINGLISSNGVKHLNRIPL